MIDSSSAARCDSETVDPPAHRLRGAGAFESSKMPNRGMLAGATACSASNEETLLDIERSGARSRAIANPSGASRAAS